MWKRFGLGYLTQIRYSQYVTLKMILKSDVNWKEKLKGILVKKLKPNSEKKTQAKIQKTQKPPTPVELSCQKTVQK